MDAKFRAVRIYGTQSTRVPPEDQPFKATSFPHPGDECSVYVGELPEEISAELRIRQAWLEAAMNRVFGGGEPLERAVPELLATNRDRPAVAGSHKWYVTYVFDRPVEVPINAEAGPGSKYTWLDIGAMDETATLLRREATDVLDALVAYTVSIITPSFFDDPVLTGAMYYLAGGDRFSIVPHFGGGSVQAHVGLTSPFPSDALRDRLAALGAREWRSHAWLGRIQSWHAAALTEEPGWRLFMASWTGLEILARKAGRPLLPRHESRTDLPSALTAAMQYDASRSPPIAADFAALTLELAETTAEADYLEFISLKDVRDRVVHGEPVPEDDLPGIQARAVLTRYLELSTEYFLRT